MTDTEEIELITTAKNRAVSVIVGAVLLGALTITVFYFTANNTLAQHGKNIEDLEREVKNVTTIPVLNQTEIKNIQKELSEFKQQYKDDTKEQKESVNDLRKQNQKMLELLYQIKQQKK